MLNAIQEAIAGGGEIPSDLHHPTFVRLLRDSGDRDAAALQLHDEEDDIADAGVARGRVLLCQADDQRGEVRLGAADQGVARASRRTSSPPVCDTSAGLWRV